MCCGAQRVFENRGWRAKKEEIFLQSVDFSLWRASPFGPRCAARPQLPNLAPLAVKFTTRAAS
jgi:hypothetical protein